MVSDVILHMKLRKDASVAHRLSNAVFDNGTPGPCNGCSQCHLLLASDTSIICSTRTKIRVSW